MSRRSFFDLFPTPKFLEMPSSGISLESGSARYLEFLRKRDSYFLKKYATLTYEPGTIAAGEIKNIEAVKQVLNNFQKDFGAKYVRATIAEEKGYIFHTKLQKDALSDIRTAVEFAIEENVPLSLKESVYDYSLLVESNPDAPEVTVSVVPEAVIMEHLNLYREQGLSPLHFEMESQAVAKAAVSRDDLNTHLCIHFFAEKAVISIVRKGAVHFSSVISLPLFVQDSKDNFSERVKLVSSEIPKVLTYWEDKKEDLIDPKNIVDIILSGLDPSENTLQDFSRNFTNDLLIKYANVWTNAFSVDSYIPEISKSDSLLYAPAVGVAMPHQIDF